MRTHVVAISATILTLSCGGPTAMTSSRPARVEPPDLILEVGAARTSVLIRPSGDPDELRGAVRATKGPERREAMQRAALGLMYAAAAEGNERTQRRLRRDSNRYAQNATRGGRDESVNALMEFIQVFNAWRAAARNADRLAERFTTRRREAGELYALMWAIRGEIALELERWNDGADAFRYYLGQLDHPLYGYGLWRTALCYRGLDRDPDAVQALTEARDLGCNPDADTAALKVATLAGHELGGSAVSWPDGTVRPSACPVPRDEDTTANDTP